ncbi:putative electron transfer flavoprotein subunit alpha [Podosphaera aphanis]|nr:putative electron transfer flavoprotein subunit alpha [Podosphaera aphanis]
MLKYLGPLVARQAQTRIRPSRSPISAAFNSAFVRSLSSLVILEQKGGKINPSSSCAVTAALKLGGEITGLVAGGSISGAATEASGFKGLSKIVAISNVEYDKGLPDNFAPLVVETIKEGDYTHVFAPHTSFGKSLMPRVAGMLDVAQISDITDILDENTFLRPIYAGNAISTVKSLDKLKIITVRGTAFAPAETKDEASASINDGKDPQVECLTEWLSENLTKSDRPNLTSAERVVSGGRGLKSKDDFDRIMLPLADALGAAVGASRAAVDSGYADNSLQVGQTGKVVAPQLYLCTGLSGAIQHLAGMKDSKVIAAINKDAEAPIFQIADVGLVGDLFEKVPELTTKLQQKCS